MEKGKRAGGMGDLLTCQSPTRRILSSNLTNNGDNITCSLALHAQGQPGAIRATSERPGAGRAGFPFAE